MRKALVIGSEGNIGKPLVRHLKQTGYEVMAADVKPGFRPNYLIADMNHPLDLLPAFDWGPDVVFLLGGLVGRLACEQAASLGATTNLHGINNVLQLAKRVKAFVVYFSTSEVYGPGCDVMDDAISDPQPNNRYGLEKLLGEKLVEYEVRSHGLKAASLRPCMIYDENEDFGDHRSAMMRFAGRLATGQPIEVHEGSARGWLHVSDMVRATEAASRLEQYQAINVGHPDIVPIAELAEMIRREVGASPDLITVKRLPERMTLVKRPTLERMRALGVVPQVSLAEGVRRVVARVKERLRQGVPVSLAA